MSLYQGHIDSPKGEEGMQLCKQAKFKQGLKTERLMVLLWRTYTVMYGTWMAKYSISRFHV